MPTDRELLHNAATALLAKHPELARRQEELFQRYRKDERVAAAAEAFGAAGGLESMGDGMSGLETVVVRSGRPALLVQKGDYVLEGVDAEIWRARLEAARKTMAPRISAVGRIELDNGRMAWVGTGWLASEDIVVTNRHVAELFCERGPQKLQFQRGAINRAERMKPRIDFNEERSAVPDPREFAILDVLHIETGDGPDMAFLRVARKNAAGTSLGEPLPLSRRAASAREEVATIGYPANDPRVPDYQLVRNIFGEVFEVKRFAPGELLHGPDGDGLVAHDCSTLGGNSGSPVLRLGDGEVVALHFSGLYLQKNLAVPVAQVKAQVDRFLSRQVVVKPPEGLPPVVPAAPPLPPPHAPPVADGTTQWTFHLPITVTVRVGLPATATANSGGAALAPREAAAEARRLCGNAKGVVAVRPGYVFRNGWITKERAVVIATEPGAALESIPAMIGGLPVEVRAAEPADYAESRGLLPGLEALKQTSYQAPEDFALEAVDEEMEVTCHVSPDFGWATLEPFLAATRKSLTIGMYDFTAPHIADGVLAAAKPARRKLRLVLQDHASVGRGTKKDDRPEEDILAQYRTALKSRFAHAPASVGKNRQFASAYHIKVAVRDGKAFWLSSGNWQSSNQPVLTDADRTLLKPLRTFNREWHVAIENPNLARQYEQFLEFDFDNAEADAETESAQALAPAEPLFVLVPDAAAEAAAAEAEARAEVRFFPPKTFRKRVKVMPLLTPDNFQPQILKLVKGARKSVLFQNQSLNLLKDGGDDPRFAALIDALLEKQQAGLDVRIIMRGEFSPTVPLERLQDRGFDMSRVKLQDGCHNKGIVVDGARVALGSHNWTNEGTLINRDASLIFEDREIAAYYGEIFEYDWKNLARASTSARRTLRPADGSEAPGAEVYTLRELLG